LTFFNIWLITKSHDYGILPEEWKAALRKTPIPPIRPQPNHTHPDSAAKRSSARNYISNVIKSLARTPYAYQMSNTERRHGVEGRRFPVWGKDLNIDPVDDEVEMTMCLA
jgi:hypothetical protein